MDREGERERENKSDVACRVPGRTISRRDQFSSLSLRGVPRNAVDLFEVGQEHGDSTITDTAATSASNDPLAPRSRNDMFGTRVGRRRRRRRRRRGMDSLRTDGKRDNSYTEDAFLLFFFSFLFPKNRAISQPRNFDLGIRHLPSPGSHRVTNPYSIRRYDSIKSSPTAPPVSR